MKNNNNDENETHVSVFLNEYSSQYFESLFGDLVDKYEQDDDSDDLYIFSYYDKDMTHELYFTIRHSLEYGEKNEFMPRPLKKIKTYISFPRSSSGNSEMVLKTSLISYGKKDYFKENRSYSTFRDNLILSLQDHMKSCAEKSQDIVDIFRLVKSFDCDGKNRKSYYFDKNNFRVNGLSEIRIMYPDSKNTQFDGYYINYFDVLVDIDQKIIKIYHMNPGGEKCFVNSLKFQSYYKLTDAINKCNSIILGETGNIFGLLKSLDGQKHESY
jgi:hypothetical protein